MSVYAKSRTSYLLDLHHIKLAVSEWGPETGLPILALHGWLDNMASFYPLIGDGDWLEQRSLRFIAVDLAGHGGSEHRSEAQGYPFLDNVDDLHQVVDRLGLQDFILMGHSMGGAIATLYAGTQIPSLAALILIESLGPLTHQPEQAPEQLVKHLKARHRHLKQEGQRYQDLSQLVKLRAENNQFEEHYARLILERNMRPVEDGYVWRSDPRLRIPSAIYLTDQQVDAFVARIECPVLLIHATDGPWKSYPALGKRAELLTNKDIVPLAGGHHLHMTNASQVRDEILHYISKLRHICDI